jgi:hypothetical protein
MTASLRWHPTRSVPRALRNLARNPRATVGWLLQETAYQLLFDIGSHFGVFTLAALRYVSPQLLFGFRAVGVAWAYRREERGA